MDSDVQVAGRTRLDEHVSLWLPVAECPQIPMTSRVSWVAALLVVCLCGVGLPAQQGRVHDEVPLVPDLTARYVIYLHGRIIEDQGRRPTDSRWGTYEYEQILDALAAAGLTVISEQRKPNTDIDKFAEHVAAQVRSLLAAGVAPEHVTVVGFSKGGGIAMRTAARLQNPQVNFVFLAACGDGDFSTSPLKVPGRILSVYEESDDVGRSCRQLFDKSRGTGEKSEIRLTLGEQHGTFYRPHREWLTPVVGWARSGGD